MLVVKESDAARDCGDITDCARTNNTVACKLKESKAIENIACTNKPRTIQEIRKLKMRINQLLYIVGDGQRSTTDRQDTAGQERHKYLNFSLIMRGEQKISMR